MDVDVDVDVTEYMREHRYRTLYHVTEAEYANTPAAKTDWMLAIAGTEQKAQDAIAERKRSNSGR